MLKQFSILYLFWDKIVKTFVYKFTILFQDKQNLVKNIIS